ncbi:hypothetical protein PAXINDRAFT_33629, partial [Paxillus involutus ATCC 200175]
TMLVNVAEAEGLDLSTVEDAQSRIDWPKWDEAIKAKLKSLEEAGTWSVVEHLDEANVVG